MMQHLQIFSFDGIISSCRSRLRRYFFQLNTQGGDCHWLVLQILKSNIALVSEDCPSPQNNSLIRCTSFFLNCLLESCCNLFNLVTSSSFWTDVALFVPASFFNSFCPIDQSPYFIFQVKKNVNMHTTFREYLLYGPFQTLKRELMQLSFNINCFNAV